MGGKGIYLEIIEIVLVWIQVVLTMLLFAVIASIISQEVKIIIHTSYVIGAFIEEKLNIIKV